MSVNDALCCGAEPLFFLDYVAMSHDDPERLEALVQGISDGCIEADCALLGGETAIMPDIYARGDYDLAGFCVGVVERKHLIDGQAIAPGDMVLGVASQRPALQRLQPGPQGRLRLAGLGVHDHVPELGQTVGEALLTPTRIYARPVRKILQHYTVKNVVHGIAHITGGGLRDNLERILPEGTRAVLDHGSWPVPPVFHLAARAGRHRRRRDGPGLQHGHRPGAGVRSLLREQHPAHARRFGLASWVSATSRPARERLCGSKAARPSSDRAASTDTAPPAAANSCTRRLLTRWASSSARSRRGHRLVEIACFGMRG